MEEKLLTEQIEKVTELNVGFTKEKILFKLTVPLLNQKTYNLYKIYSSPRIQKVGTKDVVSFIEPHMQPYWQVLKAPTTWLYFLPEQGMPETELRNISKIRILKLKPGFRAKINLV